jgi:phytoene desaturase
MTTRGPSPDRPRPFELGDERLSERSEAFNREPVLAQTAYFRPHNRGEDVAGLDLVGAVTHPDAGVPSVLSSTKVLDAVVPIAPA